MKKGEVITDSNEFWRFVEFFEIYKRRIEEMNKFLDTLDLLKLNQGHVNNFNKFTVTKIEAVIKSP